MAAIREKISCEKFNKLVLSLLRTAAVEFGPDGLPYKTIFPRVGVPQGNVISPILANIVLHKMDLLIAK